MTAPVLTLTKAQLFGALGDFLTAVLPAGVEVFQGQENRVPEPQGADYAVMWPVSRSRLATNAHAFADGYPAAPGTDTLTESVEARVQIDVHGPGSDDNVQVIVALFRDQFGTNFFQPPDSRLTASAAGTTLTVTAQSSGTIVPGVMSVFGANLPSTAILAQLTGPLPGGLGTYQLATSQTAALGPATATAAITLAPLHADDPKQVPFLNAESQVEYRWVIDAVMQIKPTVQVGQDFAAAVQADLIAYPP